MNGVKAFTISNDQVNVHIWDGTTVSNGPQEVKATHKDTTVYSDICTD